MTPSTERPRGVVIVPVEPTEAMVEAVRSFGGQGGYSVQRGDEAVQSWRWMIAAAPSIDASAGEVERVARAIAASKRCLAPNALEIDVVWSSYCGQARAAIAALRAPLTVDAPDPLTRANPTSPVDMDAEQSARWGRVEPDGRISGPMVLTCNCGAENPRDLPYDLTQVDACSTCGKVFGGGA